MTGNRGSNQTMINCDDWPRWWYNQHSALVHSNRWKTAKETNGQVERLLPAPTRRDTHSVWGILTFGTGEGLVMKGLEMVHPAFSNVVSFPKNPLLLLFKWKSHPLKTSLGFLDIIRKGYSGRWKRISSLYLSHGAAGRSQGGNVCWGMDLGYTE